MNDQKTSSILQRVPVILAVTAASYGLQVPPQALRLGTGTSASMVSRDAHTAARSDGALPAGSQQQRSA